MLMLEDFESYASTKQLARHWKQPSHGAWVRQSLEPNIKQNGRFSLKYEFRLEKEPEKNYAAICISKKWDLAGFQALQFWLKPDGSGREITMQFTTADSTGANIHDLWQATYKTTAGDSAPRVVTIPFSDLHHPRELDTVGKSLKFLQGQVIELAIYVGTSDGHFGDGVFYVDDIRAVSLPKPTSAAAFDFLASSALAAMKLRAEELKIGGVAVVAYFRGDRVTEWSSKMLVVGRMKDDPTATNKGANLLGIAYAKASEMADTLENSGSGKRPPMTGEFGWKGGVIVRWGDGFLLAAFSGGKSEDDVEVSRSGIAAFQKP